MGTSPDNYCKITDMIQALLLERQTNKAMKLAFVFEGGGAKGVYHAGLLEGIAQALVSQGGMAALRPDIIAATSVGSIVGFSFWSELMYPGGATPPYAFRQSSLWRKLANGDGTPASPPNQGAEQLLVGGSLVDYVTHQKGIPFIKDVLADAQALQNDWNTVQNDLRTLGTQFATLTADTHKLRTTLSDDTVGAVANIYNRMLGPGSAWGALVTTMTTTDWTSATSAASAVTSIPGELLALPGGELTALASSLNTLSHAASDLGTALPGEIRAVATDVGNLATTSANLLIDGATGISDAISVTEAMLSLMLKVMGLLKTLAFFFAEQAAGGNPNPPAPNTPAGIAVRTNLLADHILTPTGLRMALQNFLTSAPGAPATGDAGVRADWYTRSTTGTKAPPELYMTGANLTDSRLMIYAMGPVATITKLADDATWVVDLAGSTRPHPGVLHLPVASVSPDYVYYPLRNAVNPLIESVMSSAALPVAFPPIQWTVTSDATVWGPPPTGPRPIVTHPRNRSHVVADGGVIDNAPIDIAIKAGATHIVSFELDPVLTYNSPPPPDQTAPKTMIDVYMASFSALMNRCTNLAIIDRCAENAAAGTTGRTIPIYRLGPITQYFTLKAKGPFQAGPTTVTGPIKPFDTLNFNGQWLPGWNAGEDGMLLINLEDRFMQGYQDARLMSPPVTPPPPGLLDSVVGLDIPNITAQDLNTTPAISDPVFSDYLTRAAATPLSPTGRVCWATANKAWMAVTKPFPPGKP